MTNFEKIKCIAQQLQFFIDEGIIDEKNCGSVVEEVMSTMEILSDCDFECEEGFKKDLMAFAMIGGVEQCLSRNFASNPV